MSKLSQLAEDFCLAREGKKLTIEQLSQKTRVRLELLKNFESGIFNALPPPYIIPMMKVYAKELGIPESVIDDCKHELGIHDIPDNTKQGLSSSGSFTGLNKVSSSENDSFQQPLLNEEPLWLATAFQYRFGIIASIVLFIGLLGFSYWWFFLREKAVIIRQTAKNTVLYQEESKRENQTAIKPEIPKEWISGKDTLFNTPLPTEQLQPIQSQVPVQEVVTTTALPAVSPKDTVKAKRNPNPQVPSDLSNEIVIDQLPGIPKRNSGDGEEFGAIDPSRASVFEQGANPEKKPQQKKYRLVFQFNPESTDTCKVSVMIEGKGLRSVSLYPTNRTARFDADTTMSITIEKAEAVSVILNDEKVTLPKTSGEVSNLKVAEP
ncbi:MAG: helix-turn-helix domain-containing protein [Chloroherpetonaceae bacterium]|nr:helix-turn-helix domain-containing protein [Chloroherpetonaceae bacterium]